MGIYRGAGGSGDAVNDASSEALITIQARDAALAAQAAAEAAQTAAELAETNAETAETNAETAETNAETAATNAASSASAASTSASNAASSASAASTSASNASTSASNAASSASAASTSASNASTSATNAANSATSASNSASTATTQATNASNSASAASTSATNAASSATAAAGSATNAASSATSASGSASTATTQATNAANSASAAATSATNASNSASAASTSATNASNSASAAATSATNASNSASAASTSASNAATSESNAATSASNAAASFDSFDDRYLGAKSSAPTLDNDGNALLTGALYFNTTTNEMKVWSGSAWLNAYASLSGALLATNNLSDLTNTATARTNLGVAIGTNVQAWDADLDTWATKTAPSGTVVGTSDSQTLTNKTLTAPVISTISNTGTLTLPISTDTLVGRATSDTLTNKTIALGSNTVSGTLAQFNTAVTDADLASLAGSETLTNKTISGASNTLSNIGNSSLTNSSITINGTPVSLGGSTSVGTVTSVTGTSPVASSGGATPAISLASGYGDTQNPYASKTANNFLAAPNGTAGVPTFRAIVAADIPTLNQNTTGTASNVTGTVAIANGGTGATTRQDAMDALAGAVTSGQYLRGNGTDVVMSAIQAGDIPTLNQNTTGTASNVTGTVAIANGGTGQTTANAAYNALSPMTTTGDMEYRTAGGVAARLPIGTSGQVLTVSSGIPAWATASGGGFSGATVNAVSSSALTLTSSSTQYQVVQINSVANSVVNLPSATTMSTKGYPVFVIENAGLAGVPLQIKNNAGTILGSIPIGSIGTLTLEDNSTAAGVWVLNTDLVDYNYQSDPNSITATATSPAVTEPNKTHTKGVVGLSSTLFVRYWVVNTTNAPSNTTATSTLYTQCITISGSTLTIGSTQSKQLDTFSVSSDSAISGSVQVIRLSNSAFVVLQGSYRNGLDACGNGLQGWSRNFFTSTVSGTTVTFGTASNGSIPQGSLAQNNSKASNSGYANGTLVRLSDTSFSVVYNDGINNTYNNPYNYSGSLACQTVTVSGTTQTVGTKATLGTSTYSQVLSLGALSSTAIFACYAQAGSAGAQTGRTKVVVISISGTTSTFNTAVAYESADRAVFYTGDGYTTSSGTDKAVCPSSTQVIFGSSYFYGEASISGTTPTINMINTNINVGTGSVFLTTASKAVLMGSPTAYLTIGTGGFSYQTIVSITPSTSSINPYATNIGYGSPLGAQPTTAFAHQTDFINAILGTAL